MSVLKIGLTGGIASGKTTVSDLFSALGAEVIDTDVLSRELVEPGQPALDEIRQAFGDDVLNAAGQLDRAGLRNRIFTDDAARQRLEGILHPRIRAEMLRRVAASTAPYTIVVVPLLIETGQQDLVDRVLLVDAPESTQRERAAQRDGADIAQIDRIIAAQASRVARLEHADDVITNDGDTAKLRDAVEALHRTYLRLAGV